VSAVRRLHCRLVGHDPVVGDQALYCMRCGTRWPTGKTTDPGGVDGPPYDRPEAAGFSGINPGVGARAWGDEFLGDDPGHDLPL
jgi:hypothetical protein